MEGGFKHALIPQQAAAAETNTELRGEDGFFGQQLAKNGVAECLRRRTGSFICVLKAAIFRLGMFLIFGTFEPTNP